MNKAYKELKEMLDYIYDNASEQVYLAAKRIIIIKRAELHRELGDPLLKIKELLKKKPNKALEKEIKKIEDFVYSVSD